ncbi:MAG: transposase [Candidatus Omnitrophica bacterium]|nr:transposase [Candidatus Omnitrophota bacterium]
MPRPLRIHLPDLTYHVLNRGNNRQITFAGDKDYLHYLDILRRYKEKFNFKIFAYCLMSNHIHLLIKTSQDGTISEIMKAITIAHTRYYHKRYKTTGHIWQGRFRSPIVSDDEYLLTLMCYIEQNPVRAGIVEHPERYPYSSYHSQIKIEKDNLINREENPVFLGLGNTMEERIERYREFASSLLDDDKLKLIHKSLNGQIQFSSERFLKQIEVWLAIRKKRRRGRPRIKIINP